MNNKLLIGKIEIEVEEYIGDILHIADEFSKTAIRLTNSVKSLDDVCVLNPAGFLAAQAAELYLKALIVGYEGQKGYEKIRNLKPSHDLNKLFRILINVDKQAKSLKKIIEDLNKYSGDKVRYPEFQYKERIKGIDRGSDEILKIQFIKGYVHRAFN